MIIFEHVQISKITYSNLYGGVKDREIELKINYKLQSALGEAENKPLPVIE